MEYPLCAGYCLRFEEYSLWVCVVRFFIFPKLIHNCNLTGTSELKAPFPGKCLISVNSSTEIELLLLLCLFISYFMVFRTHDLLRYFPL